MQQKKDRQTSLDEVKGKLVNDGRIFSYEKIITVMKV